MTQTAPRRSCKCGLHRSATMSDWLSTSVAAQAAPSPADLSHPKSVAKESEADVHPKEGGRPIAPDLQPPSQCHQVFREVALRDASNSREHPARGCRVQSQGRPPPRATDYLPGRAASHHRGRPDRRTVQEYDRPNASPLLPPG